MSFTVIGDAVNTSRQLQERARGCQMLVCQRVNRMVRGYVVAWGVGVVELKGYPQHMAAFEVVAAHV